MGYTIGSAYTAVKDSISITVGFLAARILADSKPELAQCGQLFGAGHVAGDVVGKIAGGRIASFRFLTKSFKDNVVEVAP